MRFWLVLLTTAIATAQAAEPPRARADTAERPAASPITDRFALRASYFGGTADTELRLDPGDGTPGTFLVAEDDLGFDDGVQQGRIELTFRLRERNRLRVDYFKLDRSGAAVLEEQITFGDETFAVNDLVVSSLDWRTLGFTYTYSALRRERFELGAGLGVHLLEAEARGAVPARFLREEESGVAPVPSLAIDAVWRISRRFALSARGQYLGATVDDFEGSFGDYHADLQFRWRPNLAVGIGYSLLRVDLEGGDEDESGRFALDASGPEIFLRASF